MIAHLNGVKATLAPLGYRTELFAVVEVEGQYLILEAPAWGDGVEESVCGVGDDLDVDIRVKAVAGTAEGSAIMLRRVRGLLSPDRSWTAVAVAGRVAHIRFVRSEFVGVDRSVTAADTNRHPGVAVDTYRLVSQPTA